MKRREFIKRTGQIGMLSSFAFSNLPFNQISAATPPDNYDLVAIKGGEADAMFRNAIQSFGGMKNFVKPNQTVVVKPNIGWDVEPERGANSNPKLIREIVAQCKDAGAKEVYVFDHTCDEWQYCYSNSGIEGAVIDAGGKMVPGNYERYYQEVDVPKGKRLTDAMVHELILDSDVFINVPILKNHGSTEVSLAMKNLMGVVWDRGYWHRNDLHQCIADFATFKKPDLTVIDGYYMMKRNGPRGVSKSDVVTMKSQIIATDMVAADAAAVKIYGAEPNQIDHIKYAHEMGVGTMDLESLAINRIIL